MHRFSCGFGAPDKSLTNFVLNFLYTRIDLVNNKNKVVISSCLNNRILRTKIKKRRTKNVDLRIIRNNSKNNRTNADEQSPSFWGGQIGIYNS